MEFTPKDRGERIKCKQCGNDAYANEMVLDADYKMMVCPLCVREKKIHKEIEVEKKIKEDLKELQEEEQKPAGWDEEDDMLRRMAKEKEQMKEEEPTVIMGPTEDSNKVRMKCKKCNYQFNYNTESQTPSLCPMCGTNTS